LDPRRDVRRQRELSLTGRQIEHMNAKTPLANSLPERLTAPVTQHVEQVRPANHWTVAAHQIIGQLVARFARYFGFALRSHNTLRSRIALICAEYSLFTTGTDFQNFRSHFTWFFAMIYSMTKHRLDPIASMIWYKAVEIGLDLDSPIAVELLLEGDRVKPDDDGIKRPRKWRHYRQGKRTPKDSGKNNVFEIAEDQAPGTARWFRSPMWKALKGQFADRFEVENALAESDAIAAILFKYEPLELDENDLQDLDLTDSAAPPRYRIFQPKKILKCAKLEGIDLLEVVILLLEFGKSSQSLEVSKPALHLYEMVSPKIASIPQLEGFLPDIFEAIELRYTPDAAVQYDEFLPPWHVRMFDLYEKIVDIDALREEALRPYQANGDEPTDSE
jgi:hypothetical protein